MKKRLFFFFIGAILLLIALPLSIKMQMELFHNQKMNRTYTITNVNEDFPPIDSTFNFKDHIVEIKETIKDEESYIDPWKNKIGIADVSLIVDGKEIDTLKDYPIRVEEEGLNRYYGEVAYLIVENKNNDKTQFVILLKKTRELPKMMPNGDIVGYVPVEKLTYTIYTLDEKGTLKNESLYFSERDALQTELLNAGGVVPHSIGYYTDAWEGYPTIFFPFIFPFGTLVVGSILILVFFPFRKVKKKK